MGEHNKDLTTHLVAYICPNCGASFSLPLEMTCDDHRPESVLIPVEPSDG